MMMVLSRYSKAIESRRGEVYLLDVLCYLASWGVAYRKEKRSLQLTLAYSKNLYNHQVQAHRCN